VKVRVDQIKIKKRIRKDLGNIFELKESMRKHGLINPVTINNKNQLLAGYRRLMAAKELGWNEIECSMVSANSSLEKFDIEVEENIVRKNFAPVELEWIEERRRYLGMNFFQKILFWIRKFFRWILRPFGL